MSARTTPPSPLALSLGEIRRRLDAEAAALAEARTAVAAGEEVLLEQLDGRLGALCRAVETLPPAEARTLIDDLARLNNALDDLAATVWAAVRRNPGARIFPFQLGRP
jgi:hypothetical protein